MSICLFQRVGHSTTANGNNRFDKARIGNNKRDTHIQIALYQLDRVELMVSTVNGRYPGPVFIGLPLNDHLVAGIHISRVEGNMDFDTVPR
ncbi:Lhr-like helicase [Pseudomonas syringae pv. actinidiae]|uniref:Lhr-like helicase n=1 Tax=Pseudomonas syringae pv. actinidiae TaxID=103796 RepID=A0AAN4Q921_PSESF|nr:Lhr-like helicase [Pseudomonas syringae pv. actinidiae]